MQLNTIKTNIQLNKASLFDFLSSTKTSIRKNAISRQRTFLLINLIQFLYFRLHLHSTHTWVFGIIYFY